MTHILITKQNIEYYLERFFEGETSNGEEKALYLFFRQSNLPKEYEQYREIFSYFENSLEENLPKIDNIKTLESSTSIFRLRVKKYRLFFHRIAVSAAIIILIAGGYIGYVSYQNQQFYAQHEGSYMIVNGKLITDIKILKPHIKASIVIARKLHEEAGQIVKEQEIEQRKLEKQLTKDLNDPQMEKEIEQILNQ